VTDLHVAEVLDEPTEILKQAVRELHENRALLPIIVALGTVPRSKRYLIHSLGYEAKLIERLRKLIEMGLVVKSGKDKYQLMGICPVLVAKAMSAIGGPVQQPVMAPQVVATVPVPKSAPTTQAEKIAAQFKVPAVRHGQQASMGGVMPCATCHNPTPLKYGLTPTCYKCARS